MAKAAERELTRVLDELRAGLDEETFAKVLQILAPRHVTNIHKVEIKVDDTAGDPNDCS